MKQDIILLALESSCDDLSICLYNHTTQQVIALKTLTQHEHAQWGGTVPEIASREHLYHIDTVLHEVLYAAKYSLQNIDYFAVTYGPGLPGALLVGYSFMKALAWSNQKPLIPINHLEGHIYSSLLEQTPPFPHICLSVSGGHTALYYVHNEKEYTLLGNTLDDAAGECFDKVSKMLGLGFPGGAIIEEYAQKNNFNDSRHYPRLNFSGYNMSFSGLKTAILYDLIASGCYNKETKQPNVEKLTEEIRSSVASSLLAAVKDILFSRIEYTLGHYPNTKAVTFVGGVSCNNYLRHELQTLLQKKYTLPCIVCKKAYTTDNAAMIAKRASLLLQHHIYDNTNYTGDILS